MVETILAFLAGWFLSWPSLAILLGIGILFEHNEARGMAIFLIIVSAITAFFFFDMTLAQVAVYAGIYLVIGTIWSFWRYRRYVRSTVERLRSSGKSPSYKAMELESLAPSQNTNTIVAWIIVWPFSAVDNIAGDLINLLTELVNNVFRQIYASIYTSATKGLAADIERAKVEADGDDGRA